LDLSIVVVNTNTLNLLRDCLESIYRNTAGIEYEVIVVDNNSVDGSVDMVKTQFPRVRVIQNDRNLGFPVSNNRGFEAGTGRYVLALNPDTIVQGNALEVVVRFLDEHREAGAAGILTLNPDGTVQPTYERFPTLLSQLFYTTPLKRLFPHHVANQDFGDYKEVDWVQGSFLTMRKTALDEVGMFDERYSPLYSEETDLCYRIKKAGWRIYHVTTASIIHFGGQTTKLMDTWFFLQLHKSKFEFFRKHRGVLYAQTYRCVRMLACLMRLGQLVARLIVPAGQSKYVRKRLRLQWNLFRFLLNPGLRMPELS
jgi:GT2 family glycosyltransferase